MVEIEKKYGFPLFTKDHSTDYLVKNERLRVSDIWAFWNYIIRMYKKKNTSVDKEFLLSLLDQAQYFYHTAEKAPIRSQPLLYYYSFLNFVKIVINFNHYFGNSIEYNHGVDSKGIVPGANLNSMKVAIKGMKGAIKTISVDHHFMTLMGDTVPTPPQYEIGIKDLLKSCIGIHRTYCETNNVLEDYLRIDNMRLWRDARRLIFKALVPKCNDSKKDQLNNSGYHIIKEVQEDGATECFFWTESITMNTYSPARRDYYQLAEIIRKKGVWYYTDGSEYRTYISSNTCRICSESIIYNLMFFFGSITRYYPFLFDSLLSEKELWIISEFLNTQPKQFLHLVTSKVIGGTILKPRTMNI